MEEVTPASGPSPRRFWMGPLRSESATSDRESLLVARRRVDVLDPDQGMVG